MRELQKNDFDGNGLVQLSVSQDVKNSSWRALHLGQPGLGMEKEYFDQVGKHLETSPTLPWTDRIIGVRSSIPYHSQGLQSKPVQAYMAFIKVEELLKWRNV